LKIIKGTREKLRAMGPIIILEDEVMEHAKSLELKDRIVYFLSLSSGLEAIPQTIGGVESTCEYRRSIGDIYRFCDNIEKVSLTKVYKTVYELLNEGKLVSSLCTTINRRVYRNVTTNEEGKFFHALRDELNTDLSDVQITCTMASLDNYTDRILDQYISNE
jgi:hypothetical protein